MQMRWCCVDQEEKQRRNSEGYSRITLPDCRHQLVGMSGAAQSFVTTQHHAVPCAGDRLSAWHGVLLVPCVMLFCQLDNVHVKYSSSFSSASTLPQELLRREGAV